MSRYPKFVRKLLGSSSKEIRFLSRILLTDQRNISYLSDLTKLQNVVMVASWRVKQALRVKCTLEPWRKALLTSYMHIRYDKSYLEYNMSKEPMLKSHSKSRGKWAMATTFQVAGQKKGKREQISA